MVKLQLLILLAFIIVFVNSSRVTLYSDSKCSKEVFTGNAWGCTTIPVNGNLYAKINWYGQSVNTYGDIHCDSYTLDNTYYQLESCVNVGLIGSFCVNCGTPCGS